MPYKRVRYGSCGNNGYQHKKKSFDATFKLKVVDYAMQNTNRSASRKFGVDEKRVREWRKQKEDLKGLPPKKKRMTGGGRRAAI